MPLGGGGLVPNLLTGNIDATVIYSPLSYKLFIEKTARSLIDYGAAVPPNMTGAWMATDKFIKDKPQVAAEDAERALWRPRLPAGSEEPRAAIKLIAEIDEIPDNIAEAELDGNIVKLSKDGAMQKDWINLALDLARMIGMTDLAPVEDTTSPVQAGADDGVSCHSPASRGESRHERRRARAWTRRKPPARCARDLSRQAGMKAGARSENKGDT